ncbi:hypothetical protein ACOI1H_25575, partial [Loktanella sp. DJP18]
MGDEEQFDHAAAGIPSRQVPLQHLRGFGVFGPGEQAVAVDRAPQGLSNRRFASQGVDDMVVVDDMSGGDDDDASSGPSFDRIGGRIAAGIVLAFGLLGGIGGWAVTAHLTGAVV